MKNSNNTIKDNQTTTKDMLTKLNLKASLAKNSPPTTPAKSNQAEPSSPLSKDLQNYTPPAYEDESIPTWLKPATIFVNHFPIAESQLRRKLKASSVEKNIYRFIVTKTGINNYFYQLISKIENYFLNQAISLSDGTIALLLDIQGEQVNFKLIVNCQAQSNEALSETEKAVAYMTFAQQGTIQQSNNKLLIDNIVFEYDPSSAFAAQLEEFEKIYNLAQTMFSRKTKASHFQPITQANIHLKQIFEHYQTSKDFYLEPRSQLKTLSEETAEQTQARMTKQLDALERAPEWLQNTGRLAPELAATMSQYLTKQANSMAPKLKIKLQDLETQHSQLQKEHEALEATKADLQKRYKLKDEVKFTKAERWALQEKKSLLKKLALGIAKVFKPGLTKKANAKHQLLGLNQSLADLSIALANIKEKQDHVSLQADRLDGCRHTLSLQRNIIELSKHLQTIFTEDKLTNQLALLQAAQEFKQTHPQLSTDNLLTKIELLSRESIAPSYLQTIEQYHQLSDKELNVQRDVLELFKSLRAISTSNTESLDYVAPLKAFIETIRKFRSQHEQSLSTEDLFKTLAMADITLSEPSKEILNQYWSQSDQELQASLTKTEDHEFKISSLQNIEKELQNSESFNLAMESLANLADQVDTKPFAFHSPSSSRKNNYRL